MRLLWRAQIFLIKSRELPPPPYPTLLKYFHIKFNFRMFLNPISLPSRAEYPVPRSSPDKASVANKPTHTRLRHSSTPNSLSSTKSIDIYVKQPFCNEAEDIYVRRLAGWEERVLKARDERKTRRLQRIRLAKAATDWNRLLLKEELQSYFSGIICFILVKNKFDNIHK